jgi:hypothetical protein
LAYSDEFGAYTVASRATTAGEQVLFIPWSMAMEYDSLLNRPIIGPILADWYAEAHRVDAAGKAGEEVASYFSKDLASVLVADKFKMWGLAAGVHFEAFYSEDEEFAPYLEALPTSYKHLPINYSPEEMKLAKGTPEMDHMDNLLNINRVIQRLFTDTLLTQHPEVYGVADEATSAKWKSEVNWAISTVQARSFSPRFPGQTDKVALYPICDLLNHEHGHSTMVAVTSSGEAGSIIREGIGFYPIVAYAPQQQVFTSYHLSGLSACAHSMLSTYGFVPSETRHDCAALTIMSVNSDNSTLSFLREIMFKRQASGKAVCIVGGLLGG